MTLEPIFAAPLAVQIHVATVVPAFVLGTWQIFLSTKGAPLHRAMGYVYLTLMTATSIAAIFIHEINPAGPFGFSLVHLFVPLTLFGVFGALRGAWTHNVTLHRNAVVGTYIGGILIAGAFAFSPGRIMHEVVFG
jgi:uncharacterized membrane protein